MIDHFAHDPHARRPALGGSSDGNRARLTFADIRNQSNRDRQRADGTRHPARRSDHAGAAAHHDVAGGVYRRAQARRAGDPVHLDAAGEGSGLSRQPFRRARDYRGAGQRRDGRRSARPMPVAEAFFDRRHRTHRMGEPARCDDAGVGATSLPRARRAIEPAICYYTSGTTREPKAVLHSHAYTYAPSLHRPQLARPQARATSTGLPPTPDGPRLRTACCSGPG